MTCSNTYASYEVPYRSTYNRKCINGKITGCGNCVGYCTYNMHPGFLTKELRKEHDCINKGCYYYIAKPPKQETSSITENSTQDILSFAKHSTTISEGVMFMRVDKQSSDNYTIYYITITKDFMLTKLKEEIESKFTCNIDFIELPYSFDVCEELFLRS